MDTSTSEFVIKLENVSKRFETISEKPQSFLETIIARFSLRHRNKYQKSVHQTLWAVKDVQFAVKAGESLGILGRNGSGKSTLLKLITRIIRPNTGRIMVAGRVSALLELGTGFHPDLTGRENVYLNASLIGLEKEYIDAHFNSIVSFSGLADFIDMPVKFYSSGMYMRLAFSIAVYIQPQILIVDEILAVGDQAFQEKCINHIFEMKRRGVTIILVSHSLDVMRQLCDRLIWMDKGVVCADGEPEIVIQKYLDYLQENTYQPLQMSKEEQEKPEVLRLGDQTVEITAVRLLNEDQEETEDFITGQPLTIEINYMAHKQVSDPEFGLAIYRKDGVQVNGPNNQFGGFPISSIEGEGKVFYHISALPLLPGGYEVSVAVHDTHDVFTYDHRVKEFYFRVDSRGTREVYGLVQIPAKWSWEPTLTNPQKEAA